MEVTHVDKTVCAEVWDNIRFWCEDNGLTSFWKYANACGIKFTCTRAGEEEDDGTIANLKIGNVDVRLMRKDDDDGDNISLWIDSICMLTYLGSSPAEVSGKYKAADVKYKFGFVLSDKCICRDWKLTKGQFRLLALASAVSLGALLAVLTSRARHKDDITQEDHYFLVHPDCRFPLLLFTDADMISDDDD